MFRVFPNEIQGSSPQTVSSYSRVFTCCCVFVRQRRYSAVLTVAKIAAGFALKRGDRIKIRGVWAEINGKDVFLAAEIKKGNFFVLKVRLTKDGTPFWSMSKEELALEKNAAGSQ